MTLIKAILSNLLSYYLSSFKILKGVVTETERLQNRFYGKADRFKSSSYQLKNSVSWKETWRISSGWVREKELCSSREMVMEIPVGTTFPLGFYH